MFVLLKRPFSTGDLFFHNRNNPVEMDDDLLPLLPSDAVIVGKTRDQTRLEVLQARQKGNLNEPNGAANEIDYNGRGRLTSDEDLLKRASAPKPTPAEEADLKNQAPTKAQLESNLKTAQANLENAQKKLAEAKTEPEKGVAKADLDMAKKGVDEAEGALKVVADQSKK